MKKKGLWIGIFLVLAFVIYDYISMSQKEEEVLQEAEQTSQIAAEEAVEVSDELEGLSDEEVEEALAAFEDRPSSDIQFGANQGDTAYDFYLEDMEGNFVSLSDYRGKKVFINFWASWCPPCRVEMPHLQEFSEENDDVVVLGVNVTSSESNLANVDSFVDEFGLTFPILYGTDELFYLYNVESLPMSYFIDSEGVVNEVVIGPVTKDILEARFSMMN